MLSTGVTSAAVAALPRGTIAVLGEALIDLVETGDDEPRLARPGGSPYNVAIGLARLGRLTTFVGRLSHDPLGTILRNHAVHSGVDLSLSVDAPEPTTVALVELGDDGGAQYRFGVAGTSDFAWTDAELASLTSDVAALHFGSLASWTPPGDAAIARRVSALREATFVSYDPNVRPQLQPDIEQARPQVEQSVQRAHLVKASAEDIAWLYPGSDVDEVARGWLAWQPQGPAVVVVTRGADGSTAHTATEQITRAVARIDVVDTVGAGDAFTSGLLDALDRRGLLTPAAVRDLDAAMLGELLDDAALVAAITCSRAGANPPRRNELTAFPAPG